MVKKKSLRLDHLPLAYPPQVGRPGSLTDVAITQAMVVIELLESAST